MCVKTNRMTDVPSPEDADFFSGVSGYSFPFKAFTADSKSSSETLHKTIHLFSRSSNFSVLY